MWVICHCLFTCFLSFLPPFPASGGPPSPWRPVKSFLPGRLPPPASPPQPDCLPLHRLSPCSHCLLPALWVHRILGSLRDQPVPTVSRRSLPGITLTATPAMCVALSVWRLCRGPHVTPQQAVQPGPLPPFHTREAQCLRQVAPSPLAVGRALTRASVLRCCLSPGLCRVSRPGCASRPTASLTGRGAPATRSAACPPLALSVGGPGLRGCPPPASRNSARLT